MKSAHQGKDISDPYKAKGMAVIMIKLCVICGSSNLCNRSDPYRPSSTYQEGVTIYTNTNFIIKKIKFFCSEEWQEVSVCESGAVR